MDDYRIVVDRRRSLLRKPSRKQMILESVVFASLIVLLFVVLTMASF
jgi:hypothetical protein